MSVGILAFMNSSHITSRVVRKVSLQPSRPAKLQLPRLNTDSPLSHKRLLESGPWDQPFYQSLNCGCRAQSLGNGAGEAEPRESLHLIGRDHQSSWWGGVGWGTSLMREH